MPIVSENVTGWRPGAQAAVTANLNENPTEAARIASSGITPDDLIDTVLAIVQVESAGDPNARGDYDATGKYNSVGLMQLNFGAGTPQGLGYTGTKDALFDPGINLYYGTKNLLRNLARYNYDLEYAIISHRYGSVDTGPSGRPVHVAYLDSVNAIRSSLADSGAQAAATQPIGCLPLSILIALGIASVALAIAQSLR